MKNLLWTVAAFATFALMGCGNDSSGSSSTPDCSKAPKLSKSCLEGTWVVNSSVATQLGAFIALDTNIAAGSLLPVNLVVQGGSSSLTFFVNSSTKNDPTASDSAVFKYDMGADGIVSAMGTYTLSADSSVILFHLIDGDYMVSGNYKARVYKDAAGSAISFGSSTTPIFSAAYIPVSKTAEIFYRAGKVE